MQKKEGKVTAAVNDLEGNLQRRGRQERVFHTNKAEKRGER
jgi:hypothetical protein